MATVRYAANALLEKRCPRCATVKPATEFYLTRHADTFADGPGIRVQLHAYCKPCARADSRRSYEARREEINARGRAERQRQAALRQPFKRVGKRCSPRYVHDWPARFWGRVEQRPGECWRWLGKPQKNGYALMSVYNRKRYTHQLAVELTSGPIPPGCDVHHVCGNRGCVNPAHLLVVSHAEHARLHPHPHLAVPRHTHCKAGHEMLGRNVIVHVLQSGKVNHHCRACKQARDRRYRAERRQGGIIPAGSYPDEPVWGGPS